MKPEPARLSVARALSLVITHIFKRAASVSRLDARQDSSEATRFGWRRQRRRSYQPGANAPGLPPKKALPALKARFMACIVSQAVGLEWSYRMPIPGRWPWAGMKQAVGLERRCQHEIRSSRPRKDEGNAQAFNFNLAARKAICIFVLAATLSATCAEQPFLLSGATVHTVSGETLSPGQVLVRDGKIAAVGESVAAAGATTIDLKGLHLYPGLICLDSDLGLTEIEAVRATEDSTEVGDYTPDVESWIAVNPDSELIPVARANGVAYFEPVPEGGVVSGQSGLVTVEGWTVEQRTVQKPIALHVFWPAMELQVATRGRGRMGGARPKSLEEQAKERRAKLQALAEFFEEAKAYAKAKTAAAEGSATMPATVPAWEAMLPYVRRELPITIHADEVRQIRSAVNWAVTNQYKVILADGRDAWMVAGLLATNKIPIIYTHTFTRPARDTEPYDIHFSAPALLHQSGVPVTFSIGSSSFDAPQARNLPYNAAQAVAFGLPEAEALKGLTLYPAELAGVAARLGSIDVGKDATLLAADGDILDLRANVKRMWIAGHEISLESRHTRLYEKYKNRPK